MDERCRRVPRIGVIHDDVSLMSKSMVIGDGIEASISQTRIRHQNATSDGKLGLAERTLSAAGAAFLSAILMNPLDVAKTRLQAQAAGAPYSHPLSNVTSRMAFFGPHMLFADLRCSRSCTHAGVHGTVAICPPDCFHYKGTLDVFYKIIRQEGFSMLWRGTNAGLALAVPTVGIYLPCYDIFRDWLEEFTAQNAPSLTPCAPLLAGSLARSLACTSCYPIELARTRMQAFKHIHGDKKPSGVWKTLVDVLLQVKSTTSFRNSFTKGISQFWIQFLCIFVSCMWKWNFLVQRIAIESCGQALGLSLLVMYLSLQSASQPLNH